MAEPDNATADTEAADWFARLGTRSVSAETLQAFQSWRMRPENAAAYRRLEELWRDADALRQDPQIRAAVEAAGRTRSRPRPQVIAAASLAGALACVIVAVLLWRPGGATYATEVGEQRLVRLEDGSQIRLDTASRVLVSLGRERRRVELAQGQALFSVAPDASRPFVVEAGPARVTAVGTVFAVRREAGATSVTLVSGTVDVASVAAPAVPERRLAAGQQALVSRRRQEVRAVDPALQTSWTEGRLIFRETPLAAAVDEVNRYLTSPVVLDAGGLSSVPVSGVFETGDRDAFVAATGELFGLQAVAAPDGSVTLTRPARKSPAAPGSPLR